MKNKYIRLGQSYYSVELEEDGLKLIPLEPDRVMTEELEHALVAKEGDFGDDNFLQEIVESAKKELTTQLKNGLKNTVLNCLGFTKESWGNGRGFEIDHCNGRMSAVSEHIKFTIQDIMSQIPHEEILLTEEEKQGIAKAYKKDLRTRYEQQMRSEMWRMVSEMAIEDARKVANSLVTERAKVVGQIVLDKLFESTKK